MGALECRLLDDLYDGKKLISWGNDTLLDHFELWRECGLELPNDILIFLASLNTLWVSFWYY